MPAPPQCYTISQYGAIQYVTLSLSKR